MVKVKDEKNIEKIIQKISKKTEIKNVEERKNEAKEKLKKVGSKNGNIEKVDLDHDENDDITKKSSFTRRSDANMYGIDSSLTTPMTLLNGITIYLSNVKVGVTGQKSNFDLKNENLTIALVYDKPDEISFSGDDPVEKETISKDDKGNKETIIYYIKPDAPSVKQTKDINTILRDISRYITESLMTKRVLKEINQGYVLLDGGIYPKGLVYNYIYMKDNKNINEQNSLIKKCFENYKNIIELTHKNSDIHIGGIVKNISSNELIQSINENVRWDKDIQILTRTLKRQNNRKLHYTIWWKKTKEMYNSYELFEDFPSSSRELPKLEDYNRAFFYVYIPKKDVILRIESFLRQVKRRSRRENFEDCILREISFNKKGDIPECIEEADKASNLSIDFQNKIKNEIVKLAKTYDEIRDYDKSNYGDN